VLAEGIRRTDKGPLHWHVDYEAKPGWPVSHNTATAREAFAFLWDSIYGDGAWQRNDFCWVYEFEVVKP